LTPLPESRRTLRALYRDVGSAAAAVARLMAQPQTPCALEFIDHHALALVREYGGLQLDPAIGALLMIEVDGSASCLKHSAQAVESAAQGEGCLEVRAARSDEEVASLWAVRKALSPALRKVAPKKINEDVVVPVSHIPTLIEFLDRLAERHRIAIVNFGHAGNGNIHVNLLIDPNDPQQSSAAERALGELFDEVLRLGGTLSGEHGIGLVKRQFVAREIAPAALALMRGIKQAFDPHGIMNPGKSIPD
jgi:D-lactate dehydrogenase